MEYFEVKRTWPALSIAAITAIGLVLTPIGANQLALFGIALPSFCVFRRITGIPCPFCGMTRSIVNLLHGRWHDAIQAHPLGPPLFLLFIIYALYRLAVGKEPENFKAWVISFVLIVLFVWSYRLRFSAF